MPITRDEIDSFHRFADDRLNNGASELTLEECLQMWRAEREREETVASIHRSLEDIAAGRVQSLDAVDAEIREEFGFPPPSQ